MNRLYIAILATILLISTPLLSSAVEKKILAHETFTLEAAGGEISVEKYLSNDEIGITIATKSGEKLLEMTDLGSEDKMFSVEESATGLLVKDLTGDNVPEVIAAAYYGPASALYVFKFDPASKKFAPMKFIDSEDADLHRNFMVSDLPASNGSDMAILADNSLRSMGKIYPSEAGKEIIPGSYLFKFVDGSFKLTETKPLGSK